MMKQPQGLISVLLDKSAREDERDDAAMDLGDYDGDHVISALLSVASCPSEENIADVAGESLAEIWTRNNNFNRKDFEKLIPIARYEALAVIQNFKPEWIEKYSLPKVDFQ